MMRKFKKYFLFVSMLFLPFFVEAYGIENYFINAELQNNGDLIVQEYFELNGSYNGFERIIKYADSNTYTFNPNSTYYGTSSLYNGDGIVLNEIRAVDKSSSFNFNSVSGDLFERTANASKGDFGVYTISSVVNGRSYLIYLPSSYNKSFYIKYTLKNMGVLHNDVGELWWKVIGYELDESVKHLEIKVNFPNNQNEFRVWAHGPLNGVVSKNENDVLVAKVDDLSSYKTIDVRAVFDKKLLVNSNKKSNVIALDKIVGYEMDAANEVNYDREQSENKLKNNIITDYKSCLEYPDRYCYNELVDDLTKITDKVFVDEYSSKLKMLKNSVVSVEEKNASTAVESAIIFKEYRYYEEALEKIDILENIDLKQVLKNQLIPVKEKIVSDEKNRVVVNNSISLILIFGIAGLSYYVYHTYKHKYDYLFNQDYLRDFPDNSSPIQVGYLLHKKITDDAVSAEILNLINKKIILYEKNPEKKNDYYLIKNKDYIYPVSDLEITLVNSIFCNFSDKISISEMKKQVKKNSYGFYFHWSNFLYKAKSKGRNAGFYDDNDDDDVNSFAFWLGFIILCFGLLFGVFGVVLIIPALILLFIGRKNFKKDKLKKIVYFSSVVAISISFNLWIYIKVANKLYQSSFGLNLVCIIISIIAICITSTLCYRSLKGEEAYRKWKALKNFMKNFGTMDEKMLPDVHLWEKYLVYALVLGCADKLSKAMELKLTEMNVVSNNINYRDFYNVNRVINKSIRSFVSTAARRQSSSSSLSGSNDSDWGSFSSGSGSGGGFSSSSRGGGGGGGGGRRF